MRENMLLALGAAESRRLRAAAIGEAGKGALELTRIWLRPLAETAVGSSRCRAGNWSRRLRGAAGGSSI
jgi:hypothetical protein